MTATLTDAQQQALDWLSERNAEGTFDRHRVLIAGGDRAPIRYMTWIKLEEAGFVEFTANRKRLRVCADKVEG